MPASPAAEQRVCTEDGVIFAAGRSDQLTCSDKCRTRKSRREAKGIPEPYDAARRAELLAGIRAVAEEGALAMAQDVLRDEIVRPYMREQMTPDVLAAIGDLVRLLPHMVAGLREELVGAPMRDKDSGMELRGLDGKPILAVDPERRLKAIALLSKYTVGSPALAPQAPPDKAPPIAINFGAVPRPNYDVTAQRTCEVCDELRAEGEFIAGSNRCRGCQAGLEAAASDMVAEQTA